MGCTTRRWLSGVVLIVAAIAVTTPTAGATAHQWSRTHHVVSRHAAPLAHADVSIADPLGDAIVRRGDIIAADASSYGPPFSYIEFGLTVADFTDPATDPHWGAGTFAEWTIDVGSPSSPSAVFSVRYYRDAMDHEVGSIYNARGGDVMCNVYTASFFIEFPASCIGRPAAFYWRVVMSYKYAESVPPSVDYAPDSGDAGPVVETNLYGTAYKLAASDGVMYSFGQPNPDGGVGGLRLNAPIVGVAVDQSNCIRSGYWLAAADGGVFAFGLPYLGSMAGRRLNGAVVGIAEHLNGDEIGYWLVGSDGGIFAFGAPYLGSLASRKLNAPIVGISATPDGKGFWLVGADGGIFAFGDATYRGSLSGRRLNAPAVGIAVDDATGGYWIATADGGVFAFGAPYLGSAARLRLVARVVGVTSAAYGPSYWLATADGGVFAYGPEGYNGSLGGYPLASPIVAIGSSLPFCPPGDRPG